MKKSKLFVLSALCAAAFCMTAPAEEERKEFPEIGMTLSFPEQYSELQGTLKMVPYGKIVEDPVLYATTVFYFAMPEDEVLSLANSQLQEDQDALTKIMHPVGLIIATEGGEELARSVINSAVVAADQEIPEVGAADGFQFFYLTEGVAENTDGMDPVYAEEYTMALETFPDVLKNAEFYAPKDPMKQMVGTQVSFETTDLDGNPVTSAELFADNEITMINYWGTWCHFCVEEMPELAQIHTRLREKGCGVIGILQDGVSPELIEKAKDIMEECGTNYPNVLLSDDMTILQTITSYPATFFVDREGKILCDPISGAKISKYEPTALSLLAQMQGTEAAAEELTEAAEGAQTAENLTESTTGTEDLTESTTGTEDLTESTTSVENAEGAEANEAAANDLSVYRVVVTDENGDPVEGAAIQFCDDSSCSFGKTDAQGTTEFNMPEGTAYEVHVLQAPEGYESTDKLFTTLDTYSDVNIVLKKAQ